ncbi:pyruvate:ferredoxin (flavodoxin) oxidoreductase [Culicoidibacter larvae]|uniref:Pyruvate:ferredoxin (Flavodoxin) oxidoreductase n=1 Tax=Culicoidibacter larvae TaxID=2579976 RepID=A0A5R8QB28_9FIRM|nr:pyruvate:ferredoxin (flavodoxin) oxidoreductase [Culicoidibacter larvae]TLG73779.1 pyruvate:ferredoxin (flavodoxin) oxidoreductase [Culicoidibacter larvae]
MSNKILKTIDGNTAAAYIAYAYTEVAAIYPITPSSNMAEATDEWATNGVKNIFGQTVNVSELQSEAGAAGAMHGVLSTGTLSTTFTASQGLLLMLPNMYKIAGERLPGVFHVSARAIASHALNIFGDHTDVMASRPTGVPLLATGSVQEVADIAPVAHLASIESSLPFCHFFDGFRTSHEIQKIEVLDYETLGSLVNQEALQDFRNRGLNSDHPYTKGTAQNPDVFFQAREAINSYYDELPGIVQKYMDELAKHTGRSYHLFDYYGAADATDVIVAMGSVTETIQETVDYLNAQGKKVGVVKVHLYRPFSVEHFLAAFPATVERISVMDRTKEPGQNGEPLYLDVVEAFKNSDKKPVIIGGRYGLGSKDTTPSQILAVYQNLASSTPKTYFTLGINDDVTHLSLPITESIVTEPASTRRCKFWGLGSDGMVGANKQAIKIIGEHTDMYSQAYFSYDSKKSGGITVSHLRFGKEPIHSTYLISEADFIGCSNQSYVDKYDLLAGLKKDGAFLLNTIWTDEELDKHLPAFMKAYIAKNNIQFYTIDATSIAREVGLGGRINMVMQSAFFNLADIIPMSDAVKYLEDGIRKAYGKKGDDIVNMNIEAVNQGINALHKVEVPAAWGELSEEQIFATDANVPAFVKNILEPINRQEGDNLPVSSFADVADGSLPNGTAAYEKRGIAIDLPIWNKDNCIQCNFCAFVCPHAAIRPFLLDGEEQKEAPADMETLTAMGKDMDKYAYRIQVSPMDCTGCNNCADICPGKKGEKALTMQPFGEHVETEKPNWDFVSEKVSEKADATTNANVKGTQFKKPLFEFSGACAGCGETPYVRLITQMFGDRMVIANATGCSSIYGGSYPSTPYTTNAKGRGPAWANSLFEDNAEFGYGMQLAYLHNRKALQGLMEQAIELGVDAELATAFAAWIEGYNDSEKTVELSAAIKALLPATSMNPEAQILLNQIDAKKDFLEKQSVWIFGGDGWAYDIGYGGVDHVLASGENVNILVMDTEVYSNTGGQASKSTPTGAIAKFASGGKRIKKKDLGLIAMTYGYVYVAQVALADRNQLVKALNEAEQYDGPSLVIAYSPCIAHGIKGGMTRTPHISEEALKSGYWHLYRYNPELKAEGKAFSLDSKEPTESFVGFIDQQVRFNSLKRQFPKEAAELYALLEEQAKEKYETYKRLAETQVL